jgi:hypothetical protein
MIGRLGNVLYWASCGIACLIVLFGLAHYFAPRGERELLLLALPLALIAYLFGRACRYILAGT